MPNNGTQFVPPGWVVANVLFGTAYLFTGPTTAVMPADIDLGDSTKYLSPWSYIGATDQGVNVTFNPSVNKIQIEEQATPAASPVTTADFTLDFALSEDTLENMNLAYGAGGSIATTAAATGQPGKRVLTLSTNFATLATAMIGKNKLGFPRVIYVPRIQSAGQVQTAFRRAADKRMYPTTLNALCDLSQIVITDITAAGL
jgi:hypothetical protein